MFIWDFLLGDVMDQFIDWCYSQIVGFLGSFFSQMGNMGVELFDMGWVQSIVLFFSYLAWSLYVTGLVVSTFETGMEYQSGRGSVKDALLNALKGFLAVSLFTLVPVELFKLSVTLQASMTAGITGYGTDFGAVADTILRESSESGFGGITGVTNPLLMIFLIVMMGYSVIKVFFANLKRGGILLIQIAVGSLYMFSVPRGYMDGFYQWCKQVSVEYDGSQCFGMDINTDAIELARLKKLVLNNDINFEQGDIFAKLNDKKFDRIFCDPPMGRMRDGQMRTAIADRNPKMADRFKSGSQWFYAAATYEMLNANGKAAVILPIGATWNTADADVRQFLMQIGAVEAVIELPQKIFDYTSIATVIVLLSHNNKAVRMVNAKNFCERGRRINELSDENITTILECLHSDTDQSRLVNLAEIGAEGWVLSPTRFLTEKVEIGESIPFGNVIKSITRGAPLTASDLDSLVSNEPTNIQYLMLGNIQNGLIENELPYLTELDSKYEKFLVKNDNLLLSKNGAPFKVAIAQVAPGKKILANGNLFVIELDEEKADPYCAKAFLESEAGTALLRSIAVGSAMPNISLDALRKLPIPKLPMEQQKRIREKYMTVSDRIVLLRRQLNKATDELGHIFDTESQNC